MMYMANRVGRMKVGFVVTAYLLYLVLHFLSVLFPGSVLLT